jgi:hypothetical protein
VSLSDELERIAPIAEKHADPGERLVGVLIAEPGDGERVYLCAFDADEGRRAWLALDAEAEPVSSKRLVRDAASIAALCELAEEMAGGGDLDDLLSRLVALRMTEAPAGIEEAEDAVRDLQQSIEAPPRIASPAYLDRVGLATHRLERALGEGGSPFAEGMKHAMASVERLTDEVEENHKRELS